MRLQHAPICEAGITPVLLTRWQDGTLAPAEDEHLGAHVSGCAACQKRLADYEGIRQAFATQPMPDPGSDTWLALRERIDPSQASRLTEARHGRRLWQRAGALAAVLLLVVGFAGVLGSRLGLSDADKGGYVLVSQCRGALNVAATHDSPGPSVYLAASLGSLGQTASNLYAYSPRTGAVRWCHRFTFAKTYTCHAMSCPAPPLPLVGQPLVVAGTVYVCTGEGASAQATTFAFNARDGAVEWWRQTGCQLIDGPFEDRSAPVYGNSVLYSGSYALRASDGHVLWQSGVAESFAGVVGDVVYAYSLSQSAVYALDAATGAVRWTYALAPLTLAAVPSATAHTVYVASLVGDEGRGPPDATYTPNPLFAPTQPDFYALDAATGALRWRTAVGPISGGTALESGSLVYIGSRDAFSALDTATGALRWRLPLPLHGGAAVRLNAGMLYFAADGVYAVDAATGALRWHQPLGYDQSMSFGDVEPLSGRLFVTRTDGSGHGTLYALDSRTGAVMWQSSGLGQPLGFTAG